MACSPKSSPAPCLHPRRHPRCRRFTWLSPLPPILPRRTRFTSGLLLHTLLPPRCTPYARRNLFYFLAICHVRRYCSFSCAPRSAITPLCATCVATPPFPRCAPSRVVPAIIPAVRHVRRGCLYSFLCTYVRRNHQHPCGMPRASRFAATTAACHLLRNAVVSGILTFFMGHVLCSKSRLGFLILKFPLIDVTLNRGVLYL